MRPFVLALALVVLAGNASAVIPSFQPPKADFFWWPEDARAGDEVSFRSISHDPDGMVVLFRWVIDGEEQTKVFDPDTTATFPRKGWYSVTHEVTDAMLWTDSITRSVTIANTAPVPAITVASPPVYRGQPVHLLGDASDVDGDEIMRWTWAFDDTQLEGRNVSHVYDGLGTRVVTLTVIDEDGAEASVAAQLQVLNDPPRITAEYRREFPPAHETVTFEAFGVDPDVPDGPVTFSWTFSDGATYSGERVVHTFGTPGEHTVTVRGQDADGGVSVPVELTVQVY